MTSGQSLLQQPFSKHRIRGPSTLFSHLASSKAVSVVFALLKHLYSLPDMLQDFQHLTSDFPYEESRVAGYRSAYSPSSWYHSYLLYSIGLLCMLSSGLFMDVLNAISPGLDFGVRWLSPVTKWMSDHWLTPWAWQSRQFSSHLTVHWSNS